MRRSHLFVLFTLFVSVPLPAAAEGGRFGYCTVERQSTCVLDGDTFRWRGATIRIENIDAPETHDPGCAAEAALGFEAADRLIELLNAGGWELHRNANEDRDADRYGRKLRRVGTAGADFGEVLVLEKLARPWKGKRRPWC